mmetsp:Transcript_47362/g.100649  ORF Transcript_47362/g.100649 Transcript_47362/m.100649 type:complete len:311 (-) Transcript_47362:230-1162(-)
MHACPKKTCYNHRTERRHMLIFAWLKSISGWLLLNLSRISFFFSSSLVGLPIAFCLWSYIIFSTVCLVSPSRSLSWLFSGCTFCTFILGSPLHTDSHHSIRFSFCSVRTRRFPSSTVQKESSTTIVRDRSSSTIGSFPLSPILMRFLFMTTSRSFPRVPSGRGTFTESSCRVCVQTYLPSTAPPFPTGGGESSSSSPPSSPPSRPSPSSFDFAGGAPRSASGSAAGSAGAAGFPSSSAGGSPSSAAGDCEMSNPPSASNSMTSSSTSAFPSFLCFSSAFLLFFSSAASLFFRRASSFLLASSSFFLFSFR